MEDNLDNLIIGDWERSMGFAHEQVMPEELAGEAPTFEQIVDKGTQLGKEMGKGGVGALMPGEWERLGRALVYAVAPDADENRVDAFLRGIEEDPAMYSAEDFYELVGETEGPLSEEAKQVGRVMGSLFAPGGIVAGLVKKGKAVVKPAAMATAIGATAASPAAQGATAQEFNQALANQMETWHGGLAVSTADAREANKPEAQRSKDIGFGHKITKAEERSGKIYGVPFKDAQGNYIEISEEDGLKILEADMQKNVALARKQWDGKLAKIGTSWDQLEEPYRQSLSSLAYNVGGAKAGKSWTAVLEAAANKDVKRFAKEMRRKDARKYTAGMDNRVAKELYYSGLIKGLSEVQNELPLADANVAGIPQ